MAPEDGWASLFYAAFNKSRNAMVLADERRMIVAVNRALTRLLGYKAERVVGHPVYEFVEGGPLLSPQEWAARLGEGEFTGQGSIITADGDVMEIQWGATAEVVTGRRLVLFVALSTSRWGQRFRRAFTTESEGATLSRRELEIVRHVALGLSGPEIAEALDIAHDTVRTHVRNAMEKMGARSRAHLVAKALGEGHVLR